MGSLLIVLCHSHHATRGPGWAWALTWKPLWHGHSLDSGTRATAWQMHFLGRNAFKLQFSIFQHSPEATLQQVNFDVNIETPGEPLLFSASPGSHNYHSLEGSLPWTKLLSWQSLLLAKCFSTKEKPAHSAFRGVWVPVWENKPGNVFSLFFRNNLYVFWSMSKISFTSLFYLEILILCRTIVKHTFHTQIQSPLIKSESKGRALNSPRIAAFNRREL